MGRLRGHPPNAGDYDRCRFRNCYKLFSMVVQIESLRTVAGYKRLTCTGFAGGASVQAAVGWLGISYPQLACFLLFWAMQVRFVACCVAPSYRS